MRFLLSVFFGKLVFLLSRFFGLGAGGTWPGEVALRLAPDILHFFLSQVQSGVIVVAGTNGKTTTSLMVQKILESTGKTVMHNKSGANLENGIVSAFLPHATWQGSVQAAYAVLEVDENSLPLVISKIKNPNIKRLIIVLLNLFRDQLDRYGEVDVIVDRWKKALKDLPKETTVILNADDPQIAYLGKMSNQKVTYFGLDIPQKLHQLRDHATDATMCLACGQQLTYDGSYYSHLGLWRCTGCTLKRPAPDLVNYETNLSGLYNRYNATAAAAVAGGFGISDKTIRSVLHTMQPAFGRQERFVVDGQKVQIFLSKNPAGFNETLRTVFELKAKHLLLALNDRIPDGRDVSWIWDVDFDLQSRFDRITISGDRAWDMGLRIKYAYKHQIISTKSQTNSKFQIPNSKQNTHFIIEPDLQKAIETGLQDVKKNETLYILPTYSAMLAVRKILTGRKIL